MKEIKYLHNIISSSGFGTVINYCSGSDFLTSSGSGSTSQKVTVPVPQHCLFGELERFELTLHGAAQEDLAAAQRGRAALHYFDLQALVI